MLDYESLQLICGAGIAALSALAGIQTGKAKERAAQARLPVEAAVAEASNTAADAGLMEAQTKQLTLLFEHINTITARLDVEMRRTTALQEDILGVRKWAGEMLSLKDREILELKAVISAQEAEITELRARIKELENPAQKE